MTDPQREDWEALIARLERHLKHIEIGAHCDHSEGWVGRLKRGEIEQPGHWEGEVLRALDGYYAQRLTVVSRETPFLQVEGEA